MKVILAWATKKRHIAINNRLLCGPQFTGSIRQRGESGYNSITISGIPDYPKEHADSKYSHHDGQIPFKPLSNIDGLITNSICFKCQRKYAKLHKQRQEQGLELSI
jgi:hypothetical protein